MSLNLQAISQTIRECIYLISHKLINPLSSNQSNTSYSEIILIDIENNIFPKLIGINLICSGNPTKK